MSNWPDNRSASASLARLRPDRAGAALLMACALLLPPAARAYFKDAFVRLDPAAERAIAGAQKWIASNQRSDGSWKTSNGRNNTGEIAFALLALMVNGSVPGEGPFGRHVSRGAQFLVGLQKENGLVIGNTQSGPMYQHALATLALTECLGMTQSPRIRTAVTQAVDLIVHTQHGEGGWRYQPRRERGDISVTVMQVMALRAAVEAGVFVPGEAIDRAIRFIRACYHPEQQGFRYMTGSGDAGFARTAAGLVCLQSVGLYEDSIVPDVVEYLLDNAFTDGRMDHYWYGHYYASVGLYHYGGEPWKTYYPKIKERILGDWGKTGRYYSLLDTSWAVLILGVPYRYLPIYQR